MKIIVMWMNLRLGNGYNGNFVELIFWFDVVMGIEKLDDVVDSVEYWDLCVSICFCF